MLFSELYKAMFSEDFRALSLFEQARQIKEMREEKIRQGQDVTDLEACLAEIQKMIATLSWELRHGRAKKSN